MIWEQEPYVTYGSLTTMIEWKRWSAWRSSRWRRRPSTRDRWRGRWAVVKNLMKWASGRKVCFPKTLFTLYWCRIAKDDSFGDLLSQSQMHINERDEDDLVAQQRMRRRPRWWLVVLLFITFMVITRIYREDSSRITVSRNWLGLSLSKRIRHGLIVKINDKSKPRTCEALDWISANYSRARRAPASITKPHPARRGEASERARVFLHFSYHPHTYKCMQPTL
jgi:hypothetical protein